MLNRPRKATKTLLVICISGLLWAFSFGLGAPLASVWLKDAGHSETIVGLNTGVYYLGIAVTAAVVPWLMRRHGRATLIVGMIVSAVTVAWFPWGNGLFGYFLLRLLNGVGGALSLIPLETLVNQNSPPEQRSRDFGFYAFSIASGIALGTAVGMGMFAWMPRSAFVLGGVVSLFAGVVIYGWLDWHEIAREEHDARASLEFGSNFLNFGSAWVQGFLEGGMVSLMPLYLLWIGLSEARAGWLMGGIMIGVILAQVPLAWLADRLGRTTVLLGCYAVTAGVLLALHQGLHLVGMTACLFLAGACSGAFYPLGLAILGERLPSLAIPRASAWFLAINCIGSLTGPVLTGITMDLLGKQAIFLAGEGAVLFVVLAWAGVRLYRYTTSRAAKLKLYTPLDIGNPPLPSDTPIANGRAA